MTEPARRTVRHPHATQRVEDALARLPASRVTTDQVAQATELPVDLVSTIMGRMAREGCPPGTLTRPDEGRSGTFRWEPGVHRPVALVPASRRRHATPQRRSGRACPDSVLAHPSDRPMPAEDGSWVFFGNTTGRPYRVVPL